MVSAAHTLVFLVKIGVSIYVAWWLLYGGHEVHTPNPVLAGLVGYGVALLVTAPARRLLAPRKSEDPRPVLVLRTEAPKELPHEKVKLLEWRGPRA